MAEPALKVVPKEKEPTDLSKVTSAELIYKTHTPELIFALCGFMGTDIHLISDRLIYIMENDFGYVCQKIKISELIRKNADGPELINLPEGSTPEYVRVKNLIHQGNHLRSKFGESVLADLAIHLIGENRVKEATTLEENEGKTTGQQLVFKPRKVCFIIDSIKNPAELNILKTVYRRLLYCIGIFSPYEMRETYLKNKQLQPTEIVDLIEQDSHEEIKHGQGVRDTFVYADYYLRVDSVTQGYIDMRLSRFLHLIFGTSIITPTKDETAMFSAFSASSNSACLSRQIGASITDKDGNVISVGWNDVPCYHGGMYRSDSNHDLVGKEDLRCINFKNGQCQNDFNKNLLCTKLSSKLKEAGLISADDIEKVTSLLKSSDLKRLIEFSRAVHAEMHAIIIGSQKTGSQMVGGSLFTTTFPCHNCARHIVLAGISTVYYIEPYLKSLATILHSDSITENETTDKKLRILLYDGVSPRIYNRMFNYQDISKKDKDGIYIRRITREALPRFMETLEALYSLESTATKKLQTKDWHF
jgi:deoxycytidylate deaminase